MRKVSLTVIGSLMFSATALAQTATMSLTSPQNGTTVNPGDTIDWTIEFSVSSGDNLGAALVAVDLVQDNENPATLDIPPAAAVPAAMSDFSRPNGISNPGESDPTTGYTGLQRGTPGEQNLLQIGGAQNTLGQTLPPGSGVAEAAVVTGGVGQSGNVILATGSFQAPAAPGTYTYRIQTPLVNVLTAVNAPPAFSPVISLDPTDISLAPFSITFTIDGACDPCDVNCDGSVNGSDIATFVAAVQPGAPAGCSPCAGDTDNNGSVQLADIANFVNCLLGL